MLGSRSENRVDPSPVPVLGRVCGPSVTVFGSLSPADYRDIVRRALVEDVGSGDVTTLATVDIEARARGVFLVKGECVLAGADIAAETFRQVDLSVVGHLPSSRRYVMSRGRRSRRRGGPGSCVARGGTHRAQLPPAPVRHRHPHAAVRGCGRRPNRGARHEEDHADSARAGEVRGQGRRWDKPPRRPF